MADTLRERRGRGGWHGWRGVAGGLACAAALLLAQPGAATSARAPAGEGHAGAQSEAQAGRTHRVVVRGMAYVPAELQVRRGDTVVWVNEDPVPHTATARAGIFDVASLGPGVSGQWVAGVVGSFDYTCSFHPGMSGVIRVR